jgi:hypothetical protein
MSMSTTIIHLPLALLSTKTIGVSVPESLSANTKGVGIGTATAGTIGKSEASNKSKAASIAGGFFHRILAPSIFGTVDSGEALPHI